MRNSSWQTISHGHRYKIRTHDGPLTCNFNQHAFSTCSWTRPWPCTGTVHCSYICSRRPPAKSVHCSVVIDHRSVIVDCMFTVNWKSSVHRQTVNGTLVDLLMQISWATSRQVSTFMEKYSLKHFLYGAGRKLKWSDSADSFQRKRCKKRSWCLYRK